MKDAHPTTSSECPPPPADCAIAASTTPCDYDPSDVPFAYYTSTADQPGEMRDYDSEFASDLAAGTLPPVAFVKPVGYKSEHPALDVTISAGVTFVKGVVDAVAASSLAPSTLVLVTYDEGGGFFDHVAPPADSTIDHQPYGTRVPLLAIGPFAKKNYVSHVTMEHSSIVKFIEWNWLGGATGQLMGRDTAVNNLGRPPRRRQDGHGGAGELSRSGPRVAPARRRSTMFGMTLAALLLQVVGDTRADRWIVSAAWLGIITLAAIVLIVSIAPPRRHH